MYFKGWIKEFLSMSLSLVGDCLTIKIICLWRVELHWGISQLLEFTLTGNHLTTNPYCQSGLPYRLVTSLYLVITYSSSILIAGHKIHTC